MIHLEKGQVYRNMYTVYTVRLTNLDIAPPITITWPGLKLISVNFLNPTTFPHLQKVNRTLVLAAGHTFVEN